MGTPISLLLLLLTFYLSTSQAELPTNLQNCIEELKPHVHRLRGYYVQCQLKAATNLATDDSTPDDVKPNSEETEECYNTAKENDEEAEAQLTKCGELMMDLPYNKQREANQKLAELVNAAMSGKQII